MKEYNKALRFMMTLLGSCLLAILVGYWIDQRLHSTPIVLLILLFYALIGNFYLLLKGMREHE